MSTGAAAPSQITFKGPDIKNSFLIYYLQGTSAARQLAQLRPVEASDITMAALRTIDLSSALRGWCAINLLAIDIQPT